MKVSVEEARRIAVRAQLLDGSATDVLATVRRLGFLQIDVVQPVERPQHLVLFSRLGPGYDRAELDRLLWEERVALRVGRVHLPARGPAARSRPDPQLPAFAGDQEPAVGARVPDDEPCVSPLRDARARAARAAPLARARGPFCRREARPSLVGPAHGRADAPVAPPLRRGRRRRPPGRRAAVGPRVALVARDGDGLGARRASGSGPSAGSERRASDSSGASGRRTRTRQTGRCRTGPSSSPPSTASSPTATARRRCGTSTTGSRCSSRRRSASTATTCCRSSSATTSSAAPSRVSTGRRATLELLGAWGDTSRLDEALDDLAAWLGAASISR